MFIAMASEISGPPSMPSTHSRTMAKAGSAATTAPKPTRLATLSATPENTGPSCYKLYRDMTKDADFEPQ